MNYSKQVDEYDEGRDNLPSAPPISHINNPPVHYTYNNTHRNMQIPDTIYEAIPVAQPAINPAVNPAVNSISNMSQNPEIYTSYKSAPYRSREIEMNTMNQYARDGQSNNTVYLENNTQQQTETNLIVNCNKCEGSLTMPVSVKNVNLLGNIDIVCPYCGTEFMFGIQNKKDDCKCIPIPIPVPCSIL